MSDRKAYLRAAEALRDNPGQWAAYESTGNCVVLAGPGSGKTKTLVTKMARMLAEDVAEPRGIACITYNNECARELASRLADLGVLPAKRVFIGTVHSFSLTQIILPYAQVAKMGLPVGFRIALRNESAAALAVAVRNTMDYSGDPQDWASRMATYRRSFLIRNHEDWLTKDPELAALAEAYEAELRRRGLIDFDDMPLLAYRAMKEHVWLRRSLLAKFPILVVDEYQDLGLALHRMVKGLCFQTGIRLFAVGDPDQSIYGFNGARPERLIELSNVHNVETVRLKLNYRSGKNIVAAASIALGEDRGYRAVPSSSQGLVFIQPLTGDFDAQAQHLFGELLSEVMARQPELRYGDIAVIYPAAWIGDAVARAAKQAGIPLVRADAKALYPRASRLMQWLELCAQWGSGGWSSGRIRFSHLAAEGRGLFAQALSGEDAVTRFNRDLITCLSALREAAMPLHDWLSQMDDQVMGACREACTGLREDFETLAAFQTRTAPDGDCWQMTLQDMAGDGGFLNRMTLSTLHSAKGREFSVVFLFGLNEGRLPRGDVSERGLKEARRLFYVGLTRAKREVHLMHSAGLASRFVTEIEQHLQ
ncbi:ATP-dependent helicase [Achromobacter xylosoxidans]|uniref:ATP-dependent helicase n=1 Tax=Alcaligenes xylosoxydans xylosoxydans TaxID=85698 RepID=UPI00234B39DA|nr:ATP-dependent helicase [Achromobacter xylosoxidans]MDC6160144.1 ATP-dependent helicase [Achromobacter xylosoxidans]